MIRNKMGIGILFLVILVGMALIPAVSAQKEDNYSVTAEEAFKHANMRMMTLIATESYSEKWEGASIDPEPLELYDINGQKLYYEFSVYNESTLISRIDIGANNTLGSALRLIKINPKPYNVVEVMEKSIETARTKYPTGKIVSTNMVVYDYPSVGAMTIVKDQTTGVEHRIFVDAYTLEEVQDKPATETELGVRSMYEQVSKNKIDENLKDWQKSEQFTKKLEQEVNNTGIDTSAPITEENIKKLSNKLNTSSKVVSSPCNSTVMPTTTEYIGVEETNLSVSKEITAVELNNSKNDNSESDYGSSSDGNESSKNNSIPGFGLLGSLACLCGGWKFRKK
ncbi:TPA: GTPase - sulfate adenylate transferase subunit 1 [Methanosarcina acetivorans]|uniref:GTPases-Sulfate adenylate transferase subunit 1 n=2 Tax=Methanosarcina acetivorans TaxID=2214 RepID=Q8TKY6_METAC|nr:hypothetical protein [Methanosarcina acetivorans]AAM06628.1 predicted protein [Methanosarcina acetivorans C2A]HIH94997.1 GTPase - sulfate adenylate transferase subunit 1 [Methanosarcina acetivorans]